MNNRYFGFFGGVPPGFAVTTFFVLALPEKLSTSF
jgi:hypothetical protein